ncbi:MAG: hypothetical protein R3E01_23930 [Pirellulaceae bacterium]|nr:hypothetical protein [Planctomycetales bacterium]MCA9265766.1 hypothetical protein [Planctomycetales bacterium]
MSLFENPEYQWRETFFVFFDHQRRPRATELQAELGKLNDRFVITNVQADGEGRIDSLTVVSPEDYAAMDVSCISGEEVREQIPEISRDLRRSLASKDDNSKLEQLKTCDARLDIFHFEQQTYRDDGDYDDEIMDPGGLLIVLEQLGRLCQGVVVDPQSGAILS